MELFGDRFFKEELQNLAVLWMSKNLLSSPPPGCKTKTTAPVKRGYTQHGEARQRDSGAEFSVGAHRTSLISQGVGWVWSVSLPTA